MLSEIRMKNKQMQKALAKGDQDGAKLNADEMAPVVERVSERWLGSLDKEDPEIADEVLRDMKDAVNEIHITEGYPHGKVANARNSDDDWLTKIVKLNKQIQAGIPPMPTKEDRVAVADS